MLQALSVTADLVWVLHSRGFAGRPGFGRLLTTDGLILRFVFRAESPPPAEARLWVSSARCELLSETSDIATSGSSWEA